MKSESWSQMKMDKTVQNEDTKVNKTKLNTDNQEILFLKLDLAIVNRPRKLSAHIARKSSLHPSPVNVLQSKSIYESNAEASRKSDDEQNYILKSGGSFDETP